MANEVLLRFAFRLDSEGVVCTHGPLFHRWLPDGSASALVVPVDGGTLHVWFERRGFVEGGTIQYARDRHEVPEDVMARQGALEGGPLLAEYAPTAVDPAALEAMVACNKNAEAYERFGRRVCAAVFPAISNFIQVLRTDYGQHWLPVIEAFRFDSTEQSIGAYLALWWPEWSTDGGASWHKFTPGQNRATLTMRLKHAREYKNYITIDTWKEIGEKIQRGYQPSLAMRLVAQAAAFLDDGEYRYAFVEGGTALDVAVEEFVRTRKTEGVDIRGAVKGFDNFKLAAQAAIVAGFSGRVSGEDLKDGLAGLDVRHRVVHEGESPKNHELPLLHSLLRVSSTLAAGQPNRLVEPLSRNTVQSPEDWEREYKD